MFIKPFIRQSIFSFLSLGLVVFIILFIPISKADTFLLNALLSGTFIATIFVILAKQILFLKILDRGLLSLPKIQFLLSFFSVPFIGFLTFSFVPLPEFLLIIIYAVLLLGFLLQYKKIDGFTSVAAAVTTTVEKKTSFIKSIQTDVDAILADNKDNSLESSLKKLKDELKYTNPMSSSKSKTIDNEISNLVSDLSNSKGSSTKRMDIILSILKKLKQRQDSLKS
jgi:hypothetical protein